MKKKGSVHDAWYTDNAQSYLRAPEPVNMFPIKQADEVTMAAPLTIYPFFFAQYEIIEDELLLNVKGRAALDLADQDALTGLWSSVVNGSFNASQIFASRRINPANPEGSAAAIIAPGKVSPEELNYHAPNFPPSDLLQVAQSLVTENLSSIGQVDFAVSNRQDSRKTAREIQAAGQQAGLLSGVKLVPFANVIREVYDFVWTLVQHFASINAVQVPETVKPFIDRDYYVFPAGDTEVIQRAEKLAALKAFYPVVAATPIGALVLQKIIELEVPHEAPRWNAALAQPDLRPIVAQLGQVLAAIPPESMPPETAQQIQAILANAQSVLQSTQLAGGSSGVPAPSAAGGDPNQSQGPEAGQA
jgi:hypothetical protein